MDGNEARKELASKQYTGEEIKVLKGLEPVRDHVYWQHR